MKPVILILLFTNITIINIFNSFKLDLLLMDVRRLLACPIFPWHLDILIKIYSLNDWFPLIPGSQGIPHWWWNHLAAAKRSWCYSSSDYELRLSLASHLEAPWEVLSSSSSSSWSPSSLLLPPMASSSLSWSPKRHHMVGGMTLAWWTNLVHCSHFERVDLNNVHWTLPNNHLQLPWMVEDLWQRRWNQQCQSQSSENIELKFLSIWNPIIFQKHIRWI